MDNNIKTNNEYRYEILRLGMEESPFYINPSSGRREYLRNVCGLYQASPEDPVVPLSTNGNVHPLSIVLANHKLVRMQGSVDTDNGSKLFVVDPYHKVNSFSGKLLLIAKLENQTSLLWFIDATNETPKSIYAYTDQYGFSEIRDLLLFFARRFERISGDDMERVLQDKQELFFPLESNFSSLPEA